jgi:hypothetical protein
MDEVQQGYVAGILGRFPNWVDAATGKNNADPFVIGLAAAQGLTVVHDEGNGSEANPKIPYVCDKFEVRHLRVIDYFRERRLTL